MNRWLLVATKLYTYTADEEEEEGVGSGGGMAKERKRKTLPLCRMKFSLTEKTKVIVAWQVGWLRGWIANGTEYWAW